MMFLWIAQSSYYRTVSFITGQRFLEISKLALKVKTNIQESVKLKLISRLNHSFKPFKLKSFKPFKPNQTLDLNQDKLFKHGITIQFNSNHTFVDLYKNNPSHTSTLYLERGFGFGAK